MANNSVRNGCFKTNYAYAPILVGAFTIRSNTKLVLWAQELFFLKVDIFFSIISTFIT